MSLRPPLASATRTRLFDLHRPPRLALSEPPALAPRLSRLLAQTRAELAQSPRFYDGPVLLCLAASPQELVVYPATFAWRLVHDRLQGPDGQSPLGLGGVGVGLLLGDGAGRLLWTRSGGKVVGPGQWTLSAAGSVEPGQDLQAAIAQEAAEELGILTEDLQGLRLQALLVGRSPVGALLLYEATLTPTAILRPSPDEVAETRWLPDPSELTPLSLAAREVWRLYGAQEIVKEAQTRLWRPAFTDGSS